MVYRQICANGRTPEACVEIDIRAHLGRGYPVDPANRLCPAHDDRSPSLSVNPGTKGMRVVWNCLAGCDPGDIRAALLSLGVDAGCLGDYGNPDRRRPRDGRAFNPAAEAGLRRWEAVAKLSVDMDGWLYKMCVQAIGERAPGEVTADPYELLPVNQDEFIALARRAGIERGYSYRVFRNWLQRGDGKRGSRSAS